VGFGPQLADLDGDGKPDLTSGSWPGEIYWFRGEGGGKFGARDTLKLASGGALKPGNASAVAVVDWDGDGLLDIISGVIEGAVYFIRNEGTAQKPVFAKPVMLAAGGATIRVPGGDSGPCVADWDGDGRPDLLVGCGDGSVFFFRNKAAKGVPELEPPVALVSKGPTFTQPANSQPLTRPGSRAKVCVADWNGDGGPDLLVGDFNYEHNKAHGYVWVFLRKPAASSPAASSGAE
jgi:hypothetical protein